ncbi:MAG: CBS domain-containing protein, partial [Leptolyngbya sp.]|nr:CBS domain-containing protein [Leptolyngbya sp.]
MLALSPLSTAAPDLLEALSIDALIDPCPPLVQPDASIREAAQAMTASASPCVLVVEADPQAEIGLFSDQAMVAAVAAGLDPATTPVRQAMLAPAPTLHRGDSLALAFALMSRTPLPGLPVLDHQGYPYGFLNRHRLAQAPLPQSEGLGASTAEAMPLETSGLALLTHIHYQLLGLHRHNRLRVYQRCLKLMGMTSGASRVALFKLHHREGNDPLTSL